MVATSALKAPQMQPQPDGTLQHGSVTEAPRSAFLHAETAHLASRTHDGGVAAFEVHIQQLRANDLIDDTAFW